MYTVCDPPLSFVEGGDLVVALKPSRHVPSTLSLLTCMARLNCIQTYRSSFALHISKGHFGLCRSCALFWVTCEALRPVPVPLLRTHAQWWSRRSAAPALSGFAGVAEMVLVLFADNGEGFGKAACADVVDPLDPADRSSSAALRA